MASFTYFKTPLTSGKNFQSIPDSKIYLVKSENQEKKIFYIFLLYGFWVSSLFTFKSYVCELGYVLKHVEMEGDDLL